MSVSGNNKSFKDMIIDFSPLLPKCLYLQREFLYFLLWKERWRQLSISKTGTHYSLEGYNIASVKRHFQRTTGKENRSNNIVPAATATHAVSFHFCFVGSLHVSAAQTPKGAAVKYEVPANVLNKKSTTNQPVAGHGPQISAWLTDTSHWTWDCHQPNKRKHKINFNFH